MDRLVLRAATPEDTPLLADVFFQAFHPVSPGMRRAHPDTPLVRAYWDAASEFALRDPEVQSMLVLDGQRIVALGRIRAYNPADGGVLDNGTWSRVPLCADHDAELLGAAIDFSVVCRRKVMTGRSHLLVELMATVHGYQGRGVGRMLMQWICGEADRRWLPVFVETNADVVGFYSRFGFAVVDRMGMPGGVGYEAWVMVREQETNTA